MTVTYGQQQQLAPASGRAAMAVDHTALVALSPFAILVRRLGSGEAFFANGFPFFDSRGRRWD